MKNKIFPYKIVLTVFVIFLLGDICFYLILNTVNHLEALNYFLIGILVSLFMGFLNLPLHRITIKNDQLVIKQDGKRFFEKYKFTYKDIKRLEIRKVKVLRFFTAYFFEIYLQENNLDKVYSINDSIYFNKDLKSLFDYLNSNYNIPLKNNED
ncbi:MAG TPA: hypothetical protein VHT96_17005 [Clostridia bacterium]|nr:hypothetical protein [Clostridia bacterium]